MFSRSARFYDLVYGFKDYEDEARRVAQLIRARIPEARTLLDVACGTGKHLEHLRADFEVEGLDLDPALLEIARRRLPGVPLHDGDMRSFDLGRTFDALVCLFSSIGYVRTVEGLADAIATMARHVASPGVLLVEPWLTPDAWQDGHIAGLYVDEPDVKLARVNTSARRGRVSVVDFGYVIATSEGVEHLDEHHELGLFTVAEHMAAFEAAGLVVEHDPDGLIGRGAYVGVKTS